MAVAVSVAVPTVESTPGTTKTDEAAAESNPEIAAAGIGETEEIDPKIITAELIKSLPLSQLAVPYQHPPS